MFKKCLFWLSQINVGFFSIWENHIRHKFFDIFGHISPRNSSTVPMHHLHRKSPRSDTWILRRSNSFNSLKFATQTSPPDSCRLTWCFPMVALPGFNFNLFPYQIVLNQKWATRRRRLHESSWSSAGGFPFGSGGAFSHEGHSLIKNGPLVDHDPVINSESCRRIGLVFLMWRKLIFYNLSVNFGVEVGFTFEVRFEEEGNWLVYRRNEAHLVESFVVCYYVITFIYELYGPCTDSAPRLSPLVRDCLSRFSGWKIRINYPESRFTWDCFDRSVAMLFSSGLLYRTKKCIVVIVLGRKKSEYKITKKV